MTISKYACFLTDCITATHETDSGLTEDEMYGVYVSWCVLNRRSPGESAAFWTAMAHQGHSQRRLDAGRYVRPGLGMKGPAAVDYIVSSQPSLV
jgi:hypothetical protein